MTQSISELLADKHYNEPPEIEQIKKFVHAAIGLTPKVAVQTDSYVIRVPSAAAAGTLRTQILGLQKELRTNKRILIRIG